MVNSIENNVNSIFTEYLWFLLFFYKGQNSNSFLAQGPYQVFVSSPLKLPFLSTLPCAVICLDVASLWKKLDQCVENACTSLTDQRILKSHPFVKWCNRIQQYSSGFVIQSCEFEPHVVSLSKALYSPCSSWSRCTNGYQLRLRREQLLLRTGGPLTAIF